MVILCVLLTFPNNNVEICVKIVQKPLPGKEGYQQIGMHIMTLNPYSYFTSEETPFEDTLNIL